MGTNRNEGGRFTPEHTDEEFLAAVRAHEPAATSEVAVELGISRQGADYRLRRLRDEGRVANKKIGASLVWFAPSEASPEAQPDPHTRTGETAEVADAQPDSTPERSSGTGDDVWPSSGSMDTDTLDDVEFPAGRERDDCLAAILAARDYLREHGPATMREIVTAVMPEHPVDYDVPELKPGERYRGAWWRRVVKPGLNALPEVKAPARGASDWKYVHGTNREQEPNG